MIKPADDIVLILSVGFKSLFYLMLKECKMKYITHIIYCSLLIFAIEACQPKMERASLPVCSFNLDSSKQVDWKIIETDYLMSYPESMILTDKYLIIQDRKATDCLFHVINRSNDSLDFEFVRRGNGPYEFLDATLNPCWNQDEKIVSFFDPAKKAYFSFQETLIDSSSKISFKPIDKKEVLLGAEYVREMFICDRGYILMGEHGLFDKNRFMVLDNKLQMIGKYGSYPNVQNLLTNPEEDFRKMFFASSFFKISPNKTKAVFATYRGALLQLFDLSNFKDSIENFKSIQSEYPIKKEQISSEHEGWVYGFEDVYVTNDFIYAIYNGETAEDNPMLGKYIVVLNWKGELCKSYRLNLNLRCLAVDENNREIYVVACTDESDFFLARIALHPTDSSKDQVVPKAI